MPDGSTSMNFWKTNCSDILEKLHISKNAPENAPPQASPPSDGISSTAEIPSLPPTSPPQYIPQGKTLAKK